MEEEDVVTTHAQDEPTLSSQPAREIAEADSGPPSTRLSQQSSILEMVASLFFRRESAVSVTAAVQDDNFQSDETADLPTSDPEHEVMASEASAVVDEADSGNGHEALSPASEEAAESQPLRSDSGGLLSSVAALFRRKSSVNEPESAIEDQPMTPQPEQSIFESPTPKEAPTDQSDAAAVEGPMAVTPTEDPAQDAETTPAQNIAIASSSVTADSPGILEAIASMFRRRSSANGSGPVTPAEASQLLDGVGMDGPTSSENLPEPASESEGLSEGPRVSIGAQTTTDSVTKASFSESQQPDANASNVVSSSFESMNTDYVHQPATSERQEDLNALNGENDLDEEELLQIALQISIEEGKAPTNKPQSSLSPGKFEKSQSSRKSSYKALFTSKDAHEGWAIEEVKDVAGSENAAAAISNEDSSTAFVEQTSSEKLTRSQKYEKAMKKLEENPNLVDEIRFARKYRRASLVPEQDLDLYPAAEPDCGKIGKKPHLSRAHAIETTEQFRMGFYEEGQRKPFPLSCSFGWHRWPFSTYEQTDNGVLVDYGLGVSLYFKLAKALIMLFFFMSLCTLPPVIMYILGDSIQPIQRQYYKDTNDQNILGTTTMASLGQPFPVCQRVSENQTFQFTCPGAAKIQSIVAYYGQPQGSCTCPGNQTPDSQKNCPGTITGTVQNSLSNQLNYQGQQCISDSSGYTPPCFLGTTRFGIDCCSNSLDLNGYANLGTLSLSSNLQCNSFTAQYIAESICLNQNSCSFVVEV